jgi:parallel beta helix pectate lyase-like protein
VPGQVSSGPGWSYRASSHSVEVTGRGAVLSGLSIAGNLDIAASDVTVTDDRIVTAGTFGISLRHTSGVTIEHTTVSGANATTGRVDYAIDDIYGDSAGLVIRNDNLSWWRVGINAESGLVTGNYIHDPGYVAGDHTDGIYVSGGTRPLTISGNTVLNSLGQTCAIMLESAARQPVANKAIVGNLLAGGGYVIYAAGAQRDSTGIVIRGNRFGRQYYSASGRYGPVAQFQADGTGNTWSGNLWTGPARRAGLSADQAPRGQAAIIPAP